MTEPQLKTTYNLLTDCWKLIKEFHASKTDEEWNRCTDRAGELMKQYGEWSMNIIHDTLEIIERGVK